MRASRGGLLVEDRGGGVRRAVVDDHDLVRKVPGARPSTRAQNSAASPSSLSIGATTLSRRSSRADMCGGSVEPRYDPVAVTPVFANILQPLIDFFEGILEFFHDSLGLGWGWSIVALTVMVRARSCCRSPTSRRSR